MGQPQDRAVIGIDPQSTRLAAVVLEGDAFVLEYVVKMPVNVHDRCWRAFTWGRDLASEYSDATVLVELPFIGRFRTESTLGLAKTHGALLAGLVEGGLSNIDTINNRSWKKSVIGNGNATKDDITAWVAGNRPDIHSSISTAPRSIQQDLVDAACIAMYGRQ